ncbi:retron-type reverse transcriptase [Phyllobacterium myrsinacearum]|uniref:RNA-directed DNA polymerase n=2 Tax=Phyllobacterium myrsinacearum TaxID=28101 RepID=A0A839EDT9_9HYPH|nr:retron-type reverse transcriptase [Phyllobacterium myrsinacearum]
MSEYSIRKILATAPERYKEYRIPKKSGGYRDIAQPAKELKILQRGFANNFLMKLPIHHTAMAYRHKQGIRDNAQRHAGFGQILKIDFKGFFPSIRVEDWRSYCAATGFLIEAEDIDLSSLLLFHRARGTRGLRLAIGAPSSPILSNILMYEFDQRVSEIVAQDKVIYTRYADDLTFSAPRTGYLLDVKKNVSKILDELQFPRLEINHKKTTHVTTKYHRVVTGLTLANDGRVTVGRERKRLIRATIHAYIQGRLVAEDVGRLAGLIAFVKSAEPEYFGLLKHQYTPEKIIEILKWSSGTLNLFDD